uniref:Uncharacterized protein n=1 Tax=Myotis myotis TaxID=51298 RepID=A0A7J7YDT8_MYOMY|nr:hypothetical protein mMyoMyo1_011080 [Myotis myotis]
MFGRPPPIKPFSLTISFLERAPEGARGHLAAPPRHLQDQPNPNSSSAQTRRLGLRQKAPPGDPRATLEGSLHCGADNPHCSQGRRRRHLGPSHSRLVSGPIHATQPEPAHAQAQATACSTCLMPVT